MDCCLQPERRCGKVLIRQAASRVGCSGCIVLWLCYVLVPVESRGRQTRIKEAERGRCRRQRYTRLLESR